MKRIRNIAIATGLALLLHCNFVIAQEKNIVNTAAENGSFDTLVSLLVATGLDKAVAKANDITVFAPTDAAFAKLPKDVLKSLRQEKNRDQLTAILKYHVVPTELSVARRAPSHPVKSAKTLNGKKIRFQRRGNTLFVNEKSKVLLRNIKCSNGLIQVIDNVLIPSKDTDNSIVGVAEKAGSFKTLLAAAKAAGLAKPLTGKGPFTIFAPTDSAFSKLPKGTVQSLLKPENRDKLAAILKYHVIAGKKITAAQAAGAGGASTLLGSDKKLKITISDGKLLINQSTVIKNDVAADNGIIHVIDRVLIPPTQTKHTSSKSRSRSKSWSSGKQSNSQKEITITANWKNNVRRDGVQADVINIRCNSGGRVNLTNVKAGKIITSISGGGSVSISGTAKSHEARVSGGATLQAEKLATANTKISVNGGGTASVNAKDLLDYSVNAGANLNFVKTNAKIKKQMNKYANVRTIKSHH